ncbi:hypothetical protein PFISCL1PPCAC_14815, partial [Pristionchus fissidentatus]
FLNYLRERLCGPFIVSFWMSVNRPRNTEDEDDLLRMQEEFLKGNQEKKAATVVRVGRKKEDASSLPLQSGDASVDSSSPRPPIDGSRFTLDLDKESSIVDPTSNVLVGVEERNVSFLQWNESSYEELEGLSSDAIIEYSKEDGFPDVLDLSSYYSDGAESLPILPGSSFFAVEFDRLNGRISDGSVDMRSSSGGKEEDKANSSDDFSEENERRLANMNNEEIVRARREIEEKLDPNLLSWLRDRHKRRAGPSSAESDAETSRPPKKVSRFKRERMEAMASSSSSTQSTTSPIPEDHPVDESQSTIETPAVPQLKPVEELIGNLEILDEYGNREDQEKYDRLAIDAVRMELASRSMRFLLPRQQANAVKLFDMLKHKKESSVPDELLDEARNRMEEIKTLYLETVEPEGGHSSLRFASGCSPLTDSCWMLVPIRRVLDHLHASSSFVPSPSHIDTIRLSLLWSLLLYVDRPSAWGTYTEAAEVYVRLAETFLMGPSIYKDSLISSCLSRFFTSFLLPSSLSGLITIRTTARIAGLDAFAPFWDDLLRAFESDSSGCSLFSSFLLLPSYLNGSLSDGIQLRLALWSPQRSVVRQLTLKANEDQHVISLISGAKCRSSESSTELEDALFVPYAQLLGCYLAGLRDDAVIRGRNEALFDLASNELGRFVERHTKGGERHPDPNRAKEFDALVEIIRRTMSAKISF